MDFAAAWNRLWAKLALPVPVELGRRLIEAYREPQRHYHTLQHLEECLTLVEELAASAEHPEEIGLALWFHDAVYDVRAHDNEARSAQWALEALRQAGLDEERCARVQALVMATRHAAVPDTPDAKLLTDIDLAILGADEDRFAEYERQIRAEYAWVPPEVYAEKRRAVLLGFLGREHVYSTPRARGRFEGRAKRNLQRAINDAGN